MGTPLCGNTSIAEVPWQWSAAFQRGYVNLHFLTPAVKEKGGSMCLHLTNCLTVVPMGVEGNLW